MTPPPTLDAALASRFARVALANVAHEYPNKQDHVLASDEDVLPSRSLHPAFHGSFDWHSCVHMHWLLARVRRLHPALPERAAIDALFDRAFRARADRRRMRLSRAAEAAAFERTYGWAWLLMLARELARHAAATRGDGRPRSRRSRPRSSRATRLPAARAVSVALRPAREQRVRAGVRARLRARSAMRRRSKRRASPSAHALVRDDRDAPVGMGAVGRRFPVAGADGGGPDAPRAAPPTFVDWLAGWLPGFAAGEPATLFAPVAVSDRSDGHIVHLDGLNLSRAWCLRGIAGGLADARSARRGGAAPRPRACISPRASQGSRAATTRRALARDVRDAAR